MGHYATIILLGAVLIGAMLLIAMQRDAGDADRDLSEYQFKFLAREAAQTGLNLTVRVLADDTGSWDYGPDFALFTNVPYKTGTFSVRITTKYTGTGGTPPVLIDTVDVVARGRSGSGRHVIFARFERGKSDKGIPPAFQNAISSDHYMQFSGNMLVASIDGNRNASIHTNQNLELKGNSFRVEGFGTYSGTVTIGPQAIDNFDPPNDYNGSDPNHHWAPMIDIPAIDSVKLKNMALAGQGVYIDMGGGGSATPFVIDGTATPVIDFTNVNDPAFAGGGGTIDYFCSDCGTPEKPAVVYVDGPFDVFSRVEIKGNVVFMATGNVQVKPNGHGGGFFGQLNNNKETEVLLATLKDIVIGHGGGNACMGLGPSSLGAEGKNNPHCQSGNGEYTHGISVYAKGRAEMLGSPVIVGGLVADETYMDNGGNPSIIYASANEGTVDAGFEYIVPIGPILIAYSEF